MFESLLIAAQLVNRWFEPSRKTTVYELRLINSSQNCTLRRGRYLTISIQDPLGGLLSREHTAALGVRVRTRATLVEKDPSRAVTRAPVFSHRRKQEEQMVDETEIGVGRSTRARTLWLASACGLALFYAEKCGDLRRAGA